MIHLSVSTGLGSAQVMNSGQNTLANLTAAGEAAGEMCLFVVASPGIFGGDLLVEMFARQVIVESHLVALGDSAHNTRLALHPPRLGFTAGAGGDW